MRHVAKYGAVVLIVYIVLQIIVIPYMDEMSTPAHVKAAMIAQELELIEERKRLEAEQLEQQRQTQQKLAQIAQVIVYIAGGVLAIVLLSGAVILIRYACKPRVYHAKDGLYPVVERDNTPLKRRLTGDRDVAMANLNQLTNPFTLLHMDRNGKTDIQIDGGGMTPDQLMQAHKQQTLVQMAQGGYRGRVERPLSKWEVLERNGLLPVPQQKALPAPDDDTEPEPPMTLIEAIQQSSVQDGFILGQDKENNRPCKWNIASAPHGCFLGSSGMGKTTGSATTFVLEAIKDGCHVIILDKENVYWPVFKNHVEYVETDADNILWQLQYIADYIGKVSNAIEQDDDANSFEDLGNAANRVFVVIEEFAALCEDTERTGTWNKFASQMELFLKTSRKFGVHFVLISQHHDDWPKGVRQNVSFVVSYNQPVEDHSIAKVYGMSDLAPGEFANRKRIYKSWKTRDELLPILARLPRFQRRRIIGERPAGSVPNERTVSLPQDVNQPTGGSASSVTEPPNHRTIQDATDEELALWTDKQAAVIEFVRRYPNRTQKEMRETLDISKGYASELWNKFHPNGKNFTGQQDPHATKG